MAFGHEEIKTFLEGLFARIGAIRWEWERWEARDQGSHAWFFAEGTAYFGNDSAAYRASGVCERDELGEWRLAMFHGAAPD